MLPFDEVIQQDIQRALLEDIGTGDVSSQLISSDCVALAEVITREPMVVAGIPWFNAVMQAVDSGLSLTWLVEEGQRLSQPTLLCRIHGFARSILSAERTALNFLQTLSGTATQTRRLVDELQGLSTILLDTRKTIPGLRMAQKYAVLCGGGKNHRFGLYDAFLIKENHIKSCGSITRAVQKARTLNRQLFLEVEVETIEQLEEALTVGPDRILLDNFELAQLYQAVKINTPKRCELEASGGVNLANIRDIAKSGVDYISVGSMTKSVEAIDLSLLIKEIDSP